MARIDLARARALTDPAERAKALTDVLRQLDDLAAEVRADRRAAVLELRAAGQSHQDVANLLKVSRGRAQQIAEGRSNGRRAEPES